MMITKGLAVDAINFDVNEMMVIVGTVAEMSKQSSSVCFVSFITFLAVGEDPIETKVANVISVEAVTVVTEEIVQMV